MPITYQAYDISLSQYLEFIQFLESFESKQKKFRCFKPFRQKGNKVSFCLTTIPLSRNHQNNAALKARFNYLNIDNTCRHTAIDLIEQATQNTISATVSGHFFNDLPNQTQLDFGKPSAQIPFYVLPIPPTAFVHLNKIQYEIIEQIYLRMEDLLQIAPHSTQTQQKFQCLKAFYLQHLGLQEPLSLNQLLTNIQQWRRDNHSVITSLRETFFWDSFFSRQSKTTQVLDQIEGDLVKSIGQKSKT